MVGDVQSHPYMTSQPTTKTMPNGGVIKVMNPADVRCVTLKSVVGPQEHLSPVVVGSGSAYASSQSAEQPLPTTTGDKCS